MYDIILTINVILIIREYYNDNPSPNINYVNKTRPIYREMGQSALARLKRINGPYSRHWTTQKCIFANCRDVHTLASASCVITECERRKRIVRCGSGGAQQQQQHSSAYFSTISIPVFNRRKWRSTSVSPCFWWPRPVFANRPVLPSELKTDVYTRHKKRRWQCNFTLHC